MIKEPESCSMLAIILQLKIPLNQFPSGKWFLIITILWYDLERAKNCSMQCDIYKYPYLVSTGKILHIFKKSYLITGMAGVED
jgi:hypothetical protein